MSTVVKVAEPRIIDFNTTDEEIGEMRTFCEERGLVLQLIKHFTLNDRNIISKMEIERPPRCECCNRLRLTADGHLKSCLFSDQEIKINMDDIEGSMLSAVYSKPECGISCNNRSMSQIGG